MAQRIIVVGGGFAGLWSAAAAARMRDELGLGDAIEIALVAPSPFHVIRVRCYEVDLTPVRVPLDDVLPPIGVRHIAGRVTAVDVAQHAITLQSSHHLLAPILLSYDRLILACGSALHRPAIPGIESTFDVDTLEGAEALAAHIHGLAGNEPGSEPVGQWSAVVVGGGLVGLEIACELPARLAAARDRAGDAAAVRTVLIDHAAEIGHSMGEAAMPAIQQALASAGVECIGGVGVSAIDAAGVTLSDGTRLPARTVVCATGMRASPLAAQLDVARDSLGRLSVDPFMRVSGVPNVYAAGDIASALADAEGHRTVMSCQHARPMGRLAGHNVVCDLAGRPELLVGFSAPDYVTVLDLGGWGAVYTAGWDRNRLVSSGAAAKKTKRIINRERIYPPLDRDRSAILAAAAPVIQAPPATQSAAGCV